MAIVQLKRGDMFDGPCDLIVLPCSTSGTITAFVRHRLIHHNIPAPKSGMELGEVSIVPFKGGENIAQYIGYAASVKSDSSSEAAIRQIGEQLGAATKKQSTIRLVSAPLLGAGAGGLRIELVVEALSTSFKATAHRDARLVIHVLDNKILEKLSSASSQTSRAEPKSDQSQQALRVFVSYCHTSAEHKEWVEALGIFLRDSGIDVRLDAWNLRRGMDLPQFMTNELTLAERVIIVSDEKYAEKADGRVGGVGWETMLVQGDMAKLPPESTKYLVIVRSKDFDAGTPKYLQTKFVIHWSSKRSDAKNRETLLRELYNEIKVPPLGKKPVFL